MHSLTHLGCSLDGTSQTPLRSCSCPHPKPRENMAKGRARSHFMPMQYTWFLHSLLSFLSLAEHQVWAPGICLEVNTVVSPKPPSCGNQRVPEK